MKVFVCPDKFKGSASSQDVIEAISAGIKRASPKTAISAAAISDGGEGFALIASQHLDGEWITTKSQDALHRPITAQYFISDNIAYIDMSATNGLVQISVEDRNPMLSSTYGTGLLLKHAAIEKKVEKIYIGLGGSATNDGGAGMAAALGVKFLDSLDKELSPIPNDLFHCTTIDTTSILSLPPIIAACDVNNPLLGKQGATYIYGPQKGVTELADVDALLAHIMSINRGETSAIVPGAGAAGGTAYGLLHYANAKLESGFTIVSSIINLEQKIAEADIIITGEGSLDSQTLNGKGPHGVAILAKKHNKRVFAIAGQAEGAVNKYFEKILTLASTGLPLEVCMNNASQLISNLAENLFLTINQT